MFSVQRHGEQLMGIIKYTAVIYTFIYLLMCYDRVTPPDDSTDEGSLSRPLRSVQSSSLQPAPVSINTTKSCGQVRQQPSVCTGSHKNTHILLDLIPIY